MNLQPGVSFKKLFKFPFFFSLLLPTIPTGGYQVSSVERKKKCKNLTLLGKPSFPTKKCNKLVTDLIYHNIPAAHN